MLKLSAHAYSEGHGRACDSSWRKARVHEVLIRHHAHAHTHAAGLGHGRFLAPFPSPNLDAKSFFDSAMPAQGFFFTTSCFAHPDHAILSIDIWMHCGWVCGAMVGMSLCARRAALISQRTYS